MMQRLALDGPYNGLYLDELTALTEGYALITWSSGEEVWLHKGSEHLLHPEDARTINDAVLEAELR